MKKLYTLIIVLLWVTNVQAQDVELSDRLVKAYKNYQDYHQNLEARVSGNARTCITPLMFQVRMNWELLTQKAQNNLARLKEDRPTETRLDLVYESQRFLLHYTETGEDAVDLADTDNSGTSDYVELMASVFEDFMDEFVELGYYFPPADLGEGGSDKYDIYVANFVDDGGTRSYGFVASEFVIEDNPNSPIVENNSISSWMGMRNTYDDFPSSGNPDLSPRQVLEVTAAHEFFHAIQFGTGALSDGFYTEAAATSMEDQIFPGYNDNLQYILDGFANSDVALSWTSNDKDFDNDYGLRQYGLWTFFKRLREVYGDDIVKEITESYIGLSDIPGDLEQINKVLLTKGSNTPEFLRETWVPSIITMFFSDTSPTQTFTLADDFVAFLALYGITFENIFESINNFELNPLTINSVSDGNSRLMSSGFDLYYFNSPNDVDIFIESDNNDDFGAILYYTKGNELVNEEFVYSEINEGFLIRVDDIDAKDNIFIVGVFNLGDEERDFESNIQYEINLELAADCELKTWYKDVDGDGFGDAEKTELSCVQPDSNYVLDNTDCNDGNADVFPNAPAKADGLDNNCDGTIDKVNQVITFIEIDDQVDDSSSITVSVSSDSQLPVEISAVGPATVNGLNVALTGAGKVNLTFSQPGNDGYNPATEVTTSFCVKPVPVITFNPNGPSALTLTSNYESGNQWTFNGTNVSGETGSTYTVSAIGTYGLTVTIDGCNGTSEDLEVVLTPLEDLVSDFEVLMYPNPVSDFLKVESVNSDLQDLMIVDLNGVVRWKGKMTNGSSEIDLTGLSKGSYLLMIRNKDIDVVKRFKKL